MNGRLVALLPFAMGLLPFAALDAAPPRVRFDVPMTIACRDVTTEGYVQQYPSERLIEAKFTISSLLTSGDESDLRQYLFRIELPQRAAVVVDYLPKTRHESPFVGTMAMEKKEESSAQLNVNFLGQYELLLGNVNDSGFSEKKYSHLQAEMLPPVESVMASGKIDRSTGVFFKMKAGERNPLEGERDFAMVLRVPSGWQADYVRVRCQATAMSRGVMQSVEQSAGDGEQEFLVALYQEGNVRARGAAMQLVQAEANLRRVHSQDRQKPHKNYAAGNMGKLTDFFQPNAKGGRESSRVAVRTVIFGTLAEASRLDWEAMSGSEKVARAAEGYLQVRNAYATLTGEEESRQGQRTTRLPVPTEEQPRSR